jgi:hypothetical protein
VVEARLMGQFGEIDFEGRARLAIPAWCPAPVAAVGGIAYQRLVAARELFDLLLPFPAETSISPAAFCQAPNPIYA